MSQLPLPLMNRLNKTESAVFKLWMLCFQRILFQIFYQWYLQPFRFSATQFKESWRKLDSLWKHGTLFGGWYSDWFDEKLTQGSSRRYLLVSKTAVYETNCKTVNCRLTNMQYSWLSTKADEIHPLQTESYDSSRTTPHLDYYGWKHSFDR